MHFMDFILENFKKKYLGKQVEYHSFGSGAYNQCVDLANVYIKELGLTPIIGTNAKDFKDKYNPDEFEWIVNTPEAIIKKGDIPVWNGRVGGGAGHIAVALEDGTQNNFTSLDQNWSQVERVTIENHNYTNVSGWLRPKFKQSEVNTNDARKEVQFDRITSLLHKISVIPTDRSEDYIEDDKLVDAVDRLHQADQEKAERIKKLEDENEEVKKQRDESDKAIITLNSKIEDLTKAIGKDAVDDKDNLLLVKEYEDKLAEKDREIADLKAQKDRPVDEAIEHFEPILNEFWKNLIKGKKSRSLIDRIWRWIS